MNSDYYANDEYTDVYDEDYDNEVFATLKQLKELGPSTPSTPSDYQTPQYIPNHEKICLTKEQAEYVYQSVKNGTQVKPVHISGKIDKSVDVSVNPYLEALTQKVDGHLHEEPSLEMKPNMVNIEYRNRLHNQ